MRRDLAAFAAVLILSIFAIGVVLTIPSHAESRLYPYSGINLHAESGRAPRAWLEAGTSYSLGRVAPSITGSFALSRGSAVAVDFRVRVKF